MHVTPSETPLSSFWSLIWFHNFFGQFIHSERVWKVWKYWYYPSLAGTLTNVYVLWPPVVATVNINVDRSNGGETDPHRRDREAIFQPSPRFIAPCCLACKLQGRVCGSGTPRRDDRERGDEARLDGWPSEPDTLRTGQRIFTLYLPGEKGKICKHNQWEALDPCHFLDLTN